MKDASTSQSRLDALQRPKGPDASHRQGYAHPALGCSALCLTLRPRHPGICSPGAPSTTVNRTQTANTKLASSAAASYTASTQSWSPSSGRLLHPVSTKAPSSASRHHSSRPSTAHRHRYRGSAATQRTRQQPHTRRPGASANSASPNNCRLGSASATGLHQLPPQLPLHPINAPCHRSLRRVGAPGEARQGWTAAPNAAREHGFNARAVPEMARAASDGRQCVQNSRLYCGGLRHGRCPAGVLTHISSHSSACSERVSRETQPLFSPSRRALRCLLHKTLDHPPTASVTWVFTADRLGSKTQTGLQCSAAK